MGSGHVVKNDYADLVCVAGPGGLEIDEHFVIDREPVRIAPRMVVAGRV